MGRIKEGSSDNVGDHYSNKGGHKARGDFQRTVHETSRLVDKGMFGNQAQGLPQQVQWIIRRTMFRDPRSGR